MTLPTRPDPEPTSERVVLPTNDDFRRLHPRVIDHPEQIRAMLERLRIERIPLRRGMNRQVEPEDAWVREVRDGLFALTTRNFESDERSSVFLNFRLDGVGYFLAAQRPEQTTERAAARRSVLTVRLPEAIYCTERRDRLRRTPARGESCRKAELLRPDGVALVGEVEDDSPGGLGVLLPADSAPSPDDWLRVHQDIRHAGVAHARVCHATPSARRPGWVRIGLALAPGRPQPPLPIHRPPPAQARRSALRSRWQILRGAAQVTGSQLLRRVARRAERAPALEVVRYANSEGEELVGLIDSWGDTRNAPAVLIPPAWGRTKETLLPLVRTIVASFAAARMPVTVLRFDGIRKRGESFNDPPCRAPGREHHRFTFFQGVRDIQASLDFLEADPRFRPRRTVLVTFSASSIEGRRAVALENDRRLHAWICVVGASDVQSMMRVISGGVDYAGGFERGLSFGIQEILGVEVDIDHAARDGAAHEILFLEDALRDFAEITVPITWYHGRDDAWMDLPRIREALSHGTATNRHLVEIPTGHQLKSSRQAMETFQTIVAEIGRIGLGTRIPPRMPDLDDLARRSRAERGRRPRRSTNLRDFWQDYLLGRDDQSLGIELMHETEAYRELMAVQEAALDLRAGDRLADVGCGPGTFSARLQSGATGESSARVDSFDFVRAALRRGRERVGRHRRFRFVDTDLARTGIPVRSSVYDVLLASLFLSYVPDPEASLREMARVLKPGGRIVLSCLVRDADISRIYRAGVEELTARLSSSDLDPRVAERLERSMRSFLNDAARLLDLEEEGTFQFWEEEELAGLLARAGFQQIQIQRAFGDPPQALVARARKPAATRRPR